MTEVYDFPKDGWKFSYDKSDLGSKNGWYLADFNDSSWLPLSIGKFWEEQLGGDYNGFGWYRMKFKAPEIEHGKQIFVVIGGADDFADAWLNGKPIGDQHLEIGKGWETPFALDVTSVIDPGQENLLAVRVEDAGSLGGLWKSVKLMQK
jgi:beta-galactosidase